MEERTNGWMDEWTDRPTDGRTDGLTKGRMERRTNGETDERTYGSARRKLSKICADTAMQTADVSFIILLLEQAERQIDFLNNVGLLLCLPRSTTG